MAFDGSARRSLPATGARSYEKRVVVMGDQEEPGTAPVSPDGAHHFSWHQQMSSPPPSGDRGGSHYYQPEKAAAGIAPPGVPLTKAQGAPIFLAGPVHQGRLGDLLDVVSAVPENTSVRGAEGIHDSTVAEPQSMATSNGGALKWRSPIHGSDGSPATSNGGAQSMVPSSHQFPLQKRCGTR